jgi:FO synthase
MNEPIARAILRASRGAPLSDEAALALADIDPGDSAPLMQAAARRRDRAWGCHITFSPKVFLPITNLCRNFCDYCSFRRSPGNPGEWTMSPDDVISHLDRGRDAGCIEALLCLGDTPESVFPSYAKQLDDWGFDSTVSYLHWAAERALERGLLPHTNAGILTADEMARLKPVNVSLGLMLETVSERLCTKGMPHHRAPDKRPERRIAMTREAGEMSIPFTSGLLVGIGETPVERIETLLAIRDLHAAHGHIQEVIVQGFRARPAIPMHDAPEPSDEDIAHAVAMARLILPNDVSVQAPPNLTPEATAALIRAGINDFGGVSPVTQDYINHLHPWPQVDELTAACASEGFELRARLPVYDDYVARPGWVAPALDDPTRAARERLTRFAGGTR